MKKIMTSGSTMKSGKKISTTGKSMKGSKKIATGGSKGYKCGGMVKKGK